MGGMCGPGGKRSQGITVFFFMCGVLPGKDHTAGKPFQHFNQEPSSFVDPNPDRFLTFFDIAI